MANYIDGFVFPIAQDKVEQYKAIAESVAKIYKEHGALDYVEFIGDDMVRKGTQPFPELVAAGENEVVVFGWITFESRETRDLINSKVEGDPRMADLVAPLLESDPVIFDSMRMAYGGFRNLVPSSKS